MKYALQMAGLILVFGLMIFVTINDIENFSKKGRMPFLCYNR